MRSERFGITATQDDAYRDVCAHIKERRFAARERALLGEKTVTVDAAQAVDSGYSFAQIDPTLTHCGVVGRLRRPADKPPTVRGFCRFGGRCVGGLLQYTGVLQTQSTGRRLSHSNGQRERRAARTRIGSRLGSKFGDEVEIADGPGNIVSSAFVQVVVFAPKGRGADRSCLSVDCRGAALMRRLLPFNSETKRGAQKTPQPDP